VTGTAPGRVQVAGHGLRVALPHPWEARLYLRATPAAAHAQLAPAAGSAGRPAPAPAAYGHPGEIPRPILHMANFALPAERGDFGSGAVDRMRGPDVFMCLFEYDRADAGEPLFADRGIPRPRAGEFSPSALQRTLAGQAGWQRFFNESGRAFCLYVVLGSRQQERTVIPQIHGVIDELRISVS
jgi:hypothetical protein